ncbi:MAG: dTDP-4-dehydrorhamnose 3,5-epimerase, partial [Zetaproteobacteria bacterium CG_4_8_14_3_um_filter_59_5]
LSDDNHRQVWVPPGYAHGFCVLSETADVHYRCTDYFDAQDSGGVAWDDAQLAIGWPVVEPLLSDRDRALTSIASTRRWRLPQ